MNQPFSEAYSMPPKPRVLFFLATCLIAIGLLLLART